MIGAYVHHHGRGHLHRVLTVLGHLDQDSTILTSLDVEPTMVPAGVQVVQLPEDVPSAGETARRATAGGLLHWAPLGVASLPSRMARLAEWIDRARPQAVWVDVSVEIVLAVRLAGIPVATTVMPGSREDPPHTFAFHTAEALLAAWPQGAHPQSVAAIDRPVAEVGGISRFATRDPAPTRPRTGPPVVAHLSGAGGSEDARFWRAVRQLVPDAHWQSLGGLDGQWSDDPWPVLQAADVVLTGAGQGAIADCACLDTHMVVVPQSRPFAEQEATARALEGMPGISVRRLSQGPQAVAEALRFAIGRARDGAPSGFRQAWQVDGAAGRAAAIVSQPEMTVMPQ